MLERFLSNRAFWERRYIDMWTIPHTLFGVVVAFTLINFSSVGFWVGLAITTVLAIFWEAFERITKIGNEEYVSNSIGDIIVADIGFAAGTYVFSAFTDISWTIFLIIVPIWIIATILGWTAFRRYARLRA
jgi:hypothetical protein